VVSEEVECVRWFSAVLEAFALKLTIDDASFWGVGESARSTALPVSGHLPIGRPGRETYLGRWKWHRSSLPEYHLDTAARLTGGKLQ
jgi:hypothetical protein